MGEKSYVALEQALCLVCGTEHATGVLLDRRLRDSFDGPVTTHYELCPVCKRLFDEGRIALVEVDPTKGTQETPWRTGRGAHVRFEAAQKMFNVPISKKDGSRWELVYVEPGVIDKLLEMQEANREAHTDAT